MTWVADDEALEIDTSYTGHGLQSLLRAVGDLKGGSSAFVAWLSDEPCAHVFVFTGATDYVYVQVLHLPNE
ncbi:hypothetical protein GCM10009557_90050 [Virgisporangium ochraceum]|uniref:Uncharacterized protein n=1 Tax=Virgisporangium ochraceum TaxID=65505 RepID=A0A8J4A5N4_9ACTN|nr:hypothetical protein Voc01_104730 [Virgisporangium ochraceum]